MIRYGDRLSWTSGSVSPSVLVPSETQRSLVTYPQASHMDLNGLGPTKCVCEYVYPREGLQTGKAPPLRFYLELVTPLSEITGNLPPLTLPPPPTGSPATLQEGLGGQSHGLHD